MHWLERVKQVLSSGSAYSAGRASRRSETRRRKPAFESLEPRMVLSHVWQGLVDAPQTYSGALNGKIVFTSGGHGWQWNTTLGRYATDRGDNNEIIEDFGNQEQMTYYADYLLRSGATVVPMRPVGRQLNEVVLDNDSAGVTYTGAWSDSAGSLYYDEDYGAAADSVSYRFASTTTGPESAVATYTPNIPAAGLYPVYTWVARSANRTTQLYRINHTGGSTEIRVDHSKVGFGWVYLGTYHFDSGSDQQLGSVQISNNAPAGAVVIADAIRFGNGMGDSILLGAPSISGYPREDENSLHWINRMVGQGTTLGTVASTGNVSAPSNMAQYMFQGTFGEAVYIGFHSNAGGGRGARGLIDSDQGTPHQGDLALYTGRQINQDMQALAGVFEHNWYTGSSHTFSSGFGEIDLGAGAEMDATIIEVAFHDSVEDANLMRDPKARDQLGRSTYQATLEYFDVWGGLTSPVSLPTAPVNVRAASSSSGAVTVNWSAGPNTPAGVHGAAATGYRVYASIDGYGFDGGTFIAGGGTTSATLTGLDPLKPYYFKVVAENVGGQSLASEVVTALPSGGSQHVLIVNGFDRFERTQNFRYPYAHTGDGLVDRVWSRYNNSFDYVVQVHTAIHAAEPGTHVATTSNEAVISGAVDLADYDTVIWISGEESTTHDTFDATEQTKVEQFIAGGGNLFVTGSEIAWDLDQQNNGRTFYENTLKGNYVGDDANTYNVTAAAGGIFAGLPSFSFSNGPLFSSLDSHLYNVDTPDVISPQAGAQLALNYSGGTGGGAAIQVQGTAGRGSLVVFGFPFEAITSADRRQDVIERVFEFFNVPVPAVQIETYVNGQDADSPPGPTLAVSGTATFTYSVTNTGETALPTVVVVDDNGTPSNAADDFNPTFSGGDTNSNNVLDIGETWTYTGMPTLTFGQRTHIGTANVEDAGGGMATDADPTTYFGSAPSIHVESSVLGNDADTPPGPTLSAGDSANFFYVVTHIGNVVVSNVAVVDDNGTPGNPADDFNAAFLSGDSNSNNVLDFGESWVFKATPTLGYGQQTHLATATAEDSIGQIATDDDPTNYFGDAPPFADFNIDGFVDTSDYVIWRRNEGTSVPAGTNGDADYNGQVNSLDYEVWQAQYGTTTGAGGGAAAVEPQASSSPSTQSAISASPTIDQVTTPQDVVFSAPFDVTTEQRAAAWRQSRRVARFMTAVDSSDWTTLLTALAQQKADRDASGRTASSTAADADSVGERPGVEHIADVQARWRLIGKSAVRGLIRR